MTVSAFVIRFWSLELFGYGILVQRFSLLRIYIVSCPGTGAILLHSALTDSLHCLVDACNILFARFQYIQLRYLTRK